MMNDGIKKKLDKIIQQNKEIIEHLGNIAPKTDSDSKIAITKEICWTITIVVLFICIFFE